MSSEAKSPDPRGWPDIRSPQLPQHPPPARVPAPRPRPLSLAAQGLPDPQPPAHPPHPHLFCVSTALNTAQTHLLSTARASQGPVFTGVCKYFSRSKGHGFITPSDGGSDIFVHVSDIEGEYVPVEGDEVSFKLCPIPPKHLKVQAVEVNITHLAPGTKHETWTGAVVSS